MARRDGSNLIVFNAESSIYKICRVAFGRDASLYVMPFYHGLESATLVKIIVNYTKNEVTEEILEAGHSNSSNGRIKLSHHPDGFVQFSGGGLTSGIDRSTGNARGIGVNSYPLDRAARGPNFGMVFGPISNFEKLRSGDRYQLQFRQKEVEVPSTEALCFFLEGHVFPYQWRRFVRRVDDIPYIDVSHPAGASLRLKVLYPPDDWGLSYFVGIEMYALPTNTGTEPTFCSFSGATGHLRKNDDGDVIADAIHCFYPADQRIIGRNLDFSLPSVDKFEGPLDV
jgi:hypothetical protein